MRLLHVISSLNPSGGGPVEGLKQIVAEYKKIFIEVEILCCDHPESVWLDDDSLPEIHAVGPSVLSYCYCPKMKKWLADNVNRFDAVIVEGIWQYHLRAVYLSCVKEDVPYFVFVHGMLGPWFKINYKLKHLKKSLYWVTAEYWHLRKASLLFFTCEEEKKLARNSFFPYGLDGVVTGYGTSLSKNIDGFGSEILRCRFPVIENKQVILFMGRLHPVKGVDNLIVAFSKLVDNSKMHLFIAGGGQENYVEKLKSLSRRLGISQCVTFSGTLSGDEKWAAFRLADVVCIPSHHENFGVVVAEALAVGTPVLISNKVNIWREVECSGAGFVEDDTVEGTEKLLREWLSTSSDRKNDMRINAHSCFIKNFRIDAVVKSIVNKVNEYK
ncbi:glycosyl transferase family 1 [Marinobacterium zhoushanense]|uniref:Glycosyl transferase family 1 n=1 Tax=Marinobacterium zhoushanense TaxID=1679163 RepID=A0ABQ1KQI2_9GAMM|nr:glycosyltransferase [Marinobacterium zhoushanense]GGC06753.1 glycosyl transferase family 1 [Marinobacterium zhoushanense]